MLKTAVIFAGGKSSRMKRDKSLLPFNRFNSLSEFQFKRLSKYFDKVYISCKSDKFDFSSRLIFDKYSVSSPLVGVVSIFETLDDVDEIFVLSVDTPFVDIDIIQELYKNNRDEYDIILSSTDGRNQPLCAIYKRVVLKEAKKLLSQDIHKLNILISNLNSKVVEFNEIEKFMNLNYYDDYIEACNILDG